jgi:hypothetical protein
LFYSEPYFYNVAGTQITTRAWIHANARVVEHITLMVTMSDYQQQFHELRFKDRLSVADAVVLEHRLGLTKAANFVAEVDPWCYPHDDSPAFIGVKTYVQSVVAQATHAARSLSQFSDTSITDFLLSPLLVKSVILFANPRRNTHQSQEQTPLQLQPSPEKRALHLPISQIFKVMSLSDCPPSRSSMPPPFQTQ